MARLKEKKFLNYFMFVGVALIRGDYLLARHLYNHYLCLVFGVHLLLEICEPDQKNDPPFD